MKKLNKKDYIYLTITFFLFIIFIISLYNKTYIYASDEQSYYLNYQIPEYFRNLFYSTKNLLPDFAFHIGNGQNIYNLSYYGFLSPIIILSYFFPFIKMRTYLIITTILGVIISTALLYKFLHKKKYSSEICFISSFIFLISTSITFHTHKDITFINYIPFLIIGLFGVDKKFETGKSWLLTLSIFLIIMTNYYFSIGGIICLIIYTLYCYLNYMNKPTFKTFFKTLLGILVSIILALLCSAILTLPTLSTILSNGFNFEKIKSLFISNIGISKLLYNPYGLGLTFIIIPSLINELGKNKNNFLLTIFLILCILFDCQSFSFPILIQLIPLYILVIAKFLKDITIKKLNFKYLIPLLIIISIIIYISKYETLRYTIDILILTISIIIFYKTSKINALIIPILSFAFINAYLINTNDNLMLKYTEEENKLNIINTCDLITTNDNSFYRIFNDLNSNSQDYLLGNNNYYSSSSNSIIKKDNFNIENNNLLNLMLTNNKYIISSSKAMQGYELITSYNGIYIYKNDNVLPLGFATNNVLSYEDYNKFNNIVKQEALLNVIVADTQTKNDFIPTAKKVKLNYQKILKNENIKVEEDNSLSFDLKNNLQIEYKLPKKYKNKIIYIKFKVKNKNKNNVFIKINNEFKYNNNYEYFLSSTNQEKLIFTFKKGKYQLYDFETYIIDYAYIENVNKNVDKFIIDKEKTKGDIIKGNINVINNGYFMISIPYDLGFIIKVDNKKINYELVDNEYIGFKVKEGSHNITIEYKSPMKVISIIISFLGLIFFIIITYIESKRKF